MRKSCFSIDERDAWQTAGRGPHLSERFMIICLNVLHLSVHHLHICFHSAPARRWPRPTSLLYLNTGSAPVRHTAASSQEREHVLWRESEKGSKRRSDLLPARREAPPFEPQITCGEEKVPCRVVFTHLCVPFSSMSSAGLMAAWICACASHSCLRLKRLRLRLRW